MQHFYMPAFYGGYFCIKEVFMFEHELTPQVKIISKPDNILRTVYTACRTCYSADSPININNCQNAQDENKALSLINKVISSGHYSTIEHIQISFAISGISRACSHQLVRHRLMSFSQKSQRYVREKEQFDYVVPNTIKKNSELYLNSTKAYWSMTPASFSPSTGYYYIYYVTSAGGIGSTKGSANGDYNLRPVINLDANVLITSGNGTMDQPFQIKLS